jgi:branched-chain amino acid transport system permease protein
MQLFLEHTINGLAIGSIYALIALGLAMVYGILRILHVAHAGVYAVGAYVGLYTFRATGSLIVGIAAAMVVCAIVGIAIEKFIYYPLLKYPPYVPLIASIAIFISTEEVLRILAGPYIQGFPGDLRLPSVTFGGLEITGMQLLVLGTTIVILLFLWFVSEKTELGLAMQATSQDMAIASAMGVNTKRIISITFAMGSAVAAIAGILVGIYYNQVYPTMGAVPAYKTLAIIVVGGLGSIPGAVLAGILIGLAESLLIGYAVIPLPRDALAFIAMIIVFMIRPEGLLGRKTR